jgi:hypothetical protein
MDNSGRRLCHKFQTLIRFSVKQQHHIAQSIYPQQKQAQTMEQLKQHIKFLTYSNQHGPFS